MSARFAIRLLLVPLLLALACQQGAPPTVKQLAVDLRAYLGELKKWEPLEKEVFQALSEVERTYYVDDDFVIRRFKGALPRISRHVEELSVYTPKTPDVQRIHERYRDGWERMGEGFEAVIASMEAKEYARLASAKNQVETARRKLLEAFGELDTLLAEAEPELKELRQPERKGTDLLSGRTIRPVRADPGNQSVPFFGQVRPHLRLFSST
ncbi:MAG: hypothetical protein ACREQ9_15165 [Candidatus Binatia bacterium]